MGKGEFGKEDFEMIEQEYSKLRILAKKRCSSDEEFAVVEKAFHFANSAHMNVRRRSGEPYMLHPIQVAEICVMEIGLGYKSIATALLHDVVEDTDYTLEDIRNEFGDKIASLVDGLTKIKTVLDNEDRKDNVESLQAENFRRILLTLNDDVRVVLIKLADRLHNCRTIEFMPEYKRDKILAETMYIFIPLAHRLGLYSIKSEMENIWLKFTEPDTYEEIQKRIQETLEKRGGEVDEMVENIATHLLERGYKFTILKRLKSPYSIWRKMVRKGIMFDQIFDLFAIRIIYEMEGKDYVKERECAFLILYLIESLYKSKDDRLRNWISSPKQNGYEAIHCTLMGPRGAWVEVQIRSRRMDDIAEHGIAAHWTYKQEGYVSENDSEVEHWLTKVRDILTSNDVNSLGLLDMLHSDLSESEIYVFTPKGEQKTIPAGSTALDFGFLIHSKIGFHALAARVNNKLVPLSHTLHTGDQIQIITDPESRPKRDWLKFLKTRHARASVIDYFRTMREEIAEEGKEIYYNSLKERGISDTRAIFNQFRDIVQINDRQEVYFKVGLGIIGQDAFDSIAADAQPSRQVESDGKKYVLASCCRPIPGDPVIGLVDDAGVIHVHKKSCTQLQTIATKHGQRLVPAKWPDLDHDFRARIEIHGIDRIGLLNEITHFVSLNMGVNIRSLEINTNNGLVKGSLEMMVRDKSVLEKLMQGLLQINGIQDVERIGV